MATRRKTPTDTPASTPSQQDEADIVAEVGATPADDGSGELQADEAKIREVGAVDAESIRENRRIEQMVNKKRGAGGTGGDFNVDNLLEKYEGIIKFWPPNTIDIMVNRVTGTPVQWVIRSRPRSGAELYAAILAQHGRYEEAEYKVLLFDSTDKKRRGTGRITMPDTRDTPPSPQPPQPPQGQPPMNPYYPPYGQPQAGPQAATLPPSTVQVVPPTVDPVAMMGKMFELFQQMQTSAHPPPVPVVPQPAPVPAPAPFPGQSTDPMAMMSQMFGIFQKMQQSVQPPPAQPQPAPVMPSTDPVAVMQETVRLFQQMQTAPQAPQPQAVMPPPPPQGSDPGVMMAWMQQMFQMFQKMQQSQPAPQPQVQPTQPSVDPMAMMGRMFDMFQKMQQSVQPPQQPSPGSGQGGPYRGPYGGPRPYYSGPQGQQGDPPHYPSHYQTPPSARPKTAAEEFRDAVSVVQTAVDIAERFRPQASVTEPDRNQGPDDDNPVKVVDVNGWPVIVNKTDGSARKWETGVANIGNVLKWVSEQREAIQKTNAEREAKQQRQQQSLPHGYVEVTPGYQPPPGYVAVPVEMGQGLPPPPEHMPPPITQQQEGPSRSRAWGMPPMPEGAG
jgi:hypothetical protein